MLAGWFDQDVFLVRGVIRRVVTRDACVSSACTVEVGQEEVAGCFVGGYAWLGLARSRGVYVMCMVLSMLTG
jgi:hypothetical protein